MTSIAVGLSVSLWILINPLAGLSLLLGAGIEETIEFYPTIMPELPSNVMQLIRSLK